MQLVLLSAACRCLGTDFVGSSLQFVTGLAPDCTRVAGQAVGLHEYKHVAGTCIFHPGTLAHGVSWLRSGTRYSVIILLNQPELPDGTVLRIEKKELEPDVWDELVVLQNAELEAAQAAAEADDDAAAAAGAVAVAAGGIAVGGAAADGGTAAAAAAPGSAGGAAEGARCE